jgi:GT2 family glycosyltransferase
LPELSIVIPVYDNWWLTARCLRELEPLRHEAAVSFETIVVDNGSHDETPAAIAAFPWVRYLRHESNRNFAGACNAGARAAQAPLTLLLNNDAYPLGDALTPLVRAFERPEVAIAGGALFFEDGVTQAAGLVLLQNAHWHYYYRNFPAEIPPVEQARDALAVSGAAMALRTEWFVAGGGFDETYVNGFEDVDLCMRAREQGRAIAYVPQARFAHYEAASAGRFDREAENERHFYERWSPRLESLPRVARGTVGAIVVRSACRADSLLAAARDDLAAALTAFGHPVVADAIAPWQRLDRRFRRAATVAWISDEVAQPGVAIACDGQATTMRSRGAVALEVPWLPCAAPERLEQLRLRASGDPACGTVAIVGDEEGADDSIAGGDAVVRVTPAALFDGTRRDVACAVHLGRSDASSFGNVLLAQAGIPVVALASDAMRAIFAPDVAVFAQRDDVAGSVRRFLDDPNLRARYGKLVAADARRRFSPRRSAIRVVDLLCAARFGLERPGRARSNTPF